MKTILSRVHNPIKQVDILTILCTILDPTCMALRPPSANMESYLEDVMLDEDAPPGERVVAEVSQVKPITYDQKDMLVSLFDDLSVVHDRLARAAGKMPSLSKVMLPEQLMLIMKSSVWPLTPGFLDPPIPQERKELLDDREGRIKEMMIPRSDSKE